ncbi:hypothetical protein PAXRUDRAFT_478358 [Paxillus rubicundulus Ve08.2h10]|uniref:Uncharacterized protein n=1 Tax=Paxillus rubicundulus Ve08.2h10 TaxID=930991 RepID=A0A0D0DAC4_9AGAM|nr:hypothetical protein PAXRUDRAFT_478358 [Paxillus rubicundulus Ve08.2h10]
MSRIMIKVLSDSFYQLRHRTLREDVYFQSLIYFSFQALFKLFDSKDLLAQSKSWPKYSPSSVFISYYCLKTSQLHSRSHRIAVAHPLHLAFICRLNSS